MDGAVTLGKVTNKIQNCDNGYGRDVVIIFHLLCCMQWSNNALFLFTFSFVNRIYGEEELEAMNAAEDSAAD